MNRAEVVLVCVCVAILVGIGVAVPQLLPVVIGLFVTWLLMRKAITGKWMR